MKKILISAQYAKPLNTGRALVKQGISKFLIQIGLLPIAAVGFKELKDEKKIAMLAKNYLELSDGLVLQGGEDIKLENNLNDLGFRDHFEYRLLELAVKKKIPILGICRGAQFINLFFGGDNGYLDDEKKHVLKNNHGQIIDEYNLEHGHHIKIINGGFLSKKIAKKTIWVNSGHRMILSKLGHDLKKEAVGVEDDVIEAVSHKRLPILGLQWHPEEMSEGQIFFETLFR